MTAYFYSILAIVFVLRLCRKSDRYAAKLTKNLIAIIFFQG